MFKKKKTRTFSFTVFPYLLKIYINGSESEQKFFKSKFLENSWKFHKILYDIIIYPNQPEFPLLSSLRKMLVYKKKVEKGLNTLK